MRKKSHNLVRALVVLAMVVTIVGVVAAPAAAQVAGIAPVAGPVGTSVTVTATGYAPNSILTATFDTAAVTTAPVVVETSATGAATFALLIPAGCKDCRPGPAGTEGTAGRQALPEDLGGEGWLRGAQ